MSVNYIVYNSLFESPNHQAVQPYSVGFSASWGLNALPIQVDAEEPMVSAGIPVRYHADARYPIDLHMSSFIHCLHI